MCSLLHKFLYTDTKDSGFERASKNQILTIFGKEFLHTRCFRGSRVIIRDYGLGEPRRLQGFCITKIIR
jgi:hypothetical protein